MQRLPAWRLVLWWKERHPHIPLRICKIDVAKAFKWIFIALRDLGLFATDLPASLIDLPTVVVVILVCPFGWVGWGLGGSAAGPPWRIRALGGV